MRWLFLLLSILPMLGAAGMIENVPLPTPRPDEMASQKPQGSEDGGEWVGGRDDTGDLPSRTEKPVLPERNPECVDELRKLGAAFKQVERVEGAGGCGFSHAVLLTQVAPSIKVEPPATMRCETALALARWLDKEVLPGVEALGIGTERRMDEPPRLTAIRNASAYVCRRRNNSSTGKLSRHAIGAAVDVSVFIFEDGKEIGIKPRKGDHTREGAFQRAVTGGACLYFSTVLGPESDSYHSDHLHLDIAARKGGYRICQ